MEVNMRKGMCCAILMLSVLAWAKTWEYESHYPVLPEPWYFTTPVGMFTAANGNVYVTSRQRIFMLNSQGHVLRVYQPPPFFETRNHFEGIAADGQGNMYVVNSFYVSNQSIKVLIKYDSNGGYLKHIGGEIYDLHVDGANNIFAVYPDKVVKMDSECNQLLSFGSFGSGPGQFMTAAGIWVDGAGKIYVADASLARVQVFDATGQFQFMFGSQGSEPGQFDWPSDVCVDSGNSIYIADTNNYRIQEFDSSGNFLSTWGSKGYSAGQFMGAGRITTRNQAIYALDTTLNRVQIFDANGVLSTVWAPNGTAQGQLMQAQRLDVDNSGSVYICDTGNYRIQKFDRKWGIEMAFGSKGSGAGQFENPVSVAVDDEGHIFVLDKDTKRIEKFDKKGVFVTQWQGSDPFGPYYFDDPVDVDVDKDGYLYVLDKDGGFVHRFTNGGGFVATFGLKRDAQGFPLSSPVAFALDNQSRILAVNLSSEVYVNTREGAYLATLPLEPGFGPYDLNTDNQGRLYLVQCWPPRGMVTDSAGTLLASFGGGTDLLKDLNGGVSIATGNDGRAYVLEGNRVVAFRPGAGTAKAVPAAASIRGALGTDWRTDLSIFNPGSTAIDVTLGYYKADGALSSSFTLQPSTFLSLPDVIGTTFNAPNTFGALTAICLNEDQPLIFSRTYNQTDQGTYGQGIRASPYGATFYEGDNAFLTGLKNTDAFRSNVGFFNLQDIPIEVQLVLYDEAGVELAWTSYPLAALSHLQVNNLFSSLSLSGDHEAAWARVWTDTLWGRFTSYGSIVDNRTGDPVYLEAKPLGGYMPEDFHWILPAVASTPGAYGTNWRTETVFTNSLLESNEITLTYHPATGGDPFVKTFTLEPGEVKSYSDFLGEAFALDESFGWLEIDFSCAGLQARARIFTGETGTYGQGLQAQQQTTLSLGTSPVYLLNLLENENYRSNLGLLNLSDTATLFTLDLLKDASVVSSKTLTLPAQTLQQLNGVLSSFFETSGDGYTVKITGPEGAAYTAYLSTVDNRTGDAVYQSFSSQ
jgi:streptogramin lyase